MAETSMRDLARAVLAALRCIPDGEIRRGCHVYDGARVRENLRQAYRALHDAPPTSVAPERPLWALPEEPGPEVFRLAPVPRYSGDNGIWLERVPELGWRVVILRRAGAALPWVEAYALGAAQAWGGRPLYDATEEIIVPQQPTEPEMPRVLADIAAERRRQDERWGQQTHPDGTGGKTAAQESRYARERCQAAAAAGTVSWRHVLREEVAEAFAEMDGLLRTELVQVAAVAAAWIEAIDRREQPTPAPQPRQPREEAQAAYDEAVVNAAGYIDHGDADPADDGPSNG